METRKLVKASGRTFREMASQTKNRENLAVLFQRLEKLATADINLFTRSEWRALVGMQGQGPEPQPAPPLYLGSAGRRIAEYMRAANNAAVRPGGLGEPIFTAEEISVAEWSEVG